MSRPWNKGTPAPHLRPVILGQFDTFDDWCNHASRALTGFEGSMGEELKAICVDNIGRRCHIGKDFHLARDEGTFPVRYFTAMEVVDQTPPAEDPLRAALRQCATELEEASKLLRQHYPGVAEMLRIAADRAAKVAEGVREPQSVGEIIRRDQLRSIIVPAIRANMESRDTTRLTNDLIDAFIKAEMEQRQ